MAVLSVTVGFWHAAAACSGYRTVFGPLPIGCAEPARCHSHVECAIAVSAGSACPVFVPTGCVTQQRPHLKQLNGTFRLVLTNPQSIGSQPKKRGQSKMLGPLRKILRRLEKQLQCNCTLRGEFACDVIVPKAEELKLLPFASASIQRSFHDSRFTVIPTPYFA